jgi:pyruvate-ferredoxin/flavodoxin oxidoreductase
MEVMMQGYDQVKEIKIGALTAADHSSLRGQALLPILELATAGGSCGTGCRSHALPAGQAARTPLASVANFDAEFRAHFGYNQPATPLSAMGMIAAATGDTASKYVARRETPLFIPENCTQCMECISVCPDTALPNTAQDLSTLLRTAVSYYIADPERPRPSSSPRCRRSKSQARQRMVAEIKDRHPAAHHPARSHGLARRLLRQKSKSSSSPFSTRFPWPIRR